MGNFTDGGSFPAFLQPTQNKLLYSGNYINFTDSNHNQWAQQFMPDLYKKIAPIYGSNQTIAGFLKMVTNGEMSSNSDQIIWQEEGRLHTRYEKVFVSFADAAASAVGTALTESASSGAAAAHAVATIQSNQEAPDSDVLIDYSFPGNYPNEGASNSDNQCNFRVGQTVMIQNEVSGGDVLKGVVTVVAGNQFNVSFYNTDALPTTVTSTDTFTALVYGSEFAKGTGNFTEKIDSEYSTYSNAAIILKDHYAINGTDMSQVGWIDTGEGYLWYHKSKSDNMKRWSDYMEMALVEGVQADSGASIALGTYRSDYTNQGTFNASPSGRGTQGFFSALEDRGNVYQGFGDQAEGSGALTDFDNVLKQLDKQGSIEENMIYLDRDLSLEIDDILAQQNSYGAGGTSWGAFNNSEKMALKLGFSGFRRGSYDFYKTDWRYLNDHATRGGFDDIEGVLIPAGTSTVYDKIAGNKVKRPFLHVRYREGRKMKNWITGGAGGATTSDIDELRMHYLTERCLITQGANNFILFKEN